MATPETPVLPEVAPIERTEQFCAALGVDIRHGGPQAYYTCRCRSSPFRDAVAYYAVLLHECGHHAVMGIMPNS
jgi:antirestriction protein ArdC